MQPQTFSFRQITIQEMFDLLITLGPKKSTPQEAIPLKILHENANLFSLSLTAFVNKRVSTFPDHLILSNVSSLCKKDGSTSKQNYRPISLLPATSKVFERIIYNQLIDRTNAFLYPPLGGIRKRCSTEHVIFLQAFKAMMKRNWLELF